MMQVTHNVACLARWMAADLYLREVDVLRFEVTIYHNPACHILTLISRHILPDLMLDTICLIPYVRYHMLDTICVIPFQSCANVSQAMLSSTHSAQHTSRIDIIPFVHCLPVAFIC